MYRLLEKLTSRLPVISSRSFLLFSGNHNPYLQIEPLQSPDLSENPGYLHQIQRNASVQRYRLVHFHEFALHKLHPVYRHECKHHTLVLENTVPVPYRNPDLQNEEFDYPCFQ